jgi:hypothetical protein
MVESTQAISTKTTLKAMGCMNGAMEGDMMVNGKIIKCTEKGFLRGRMGEGTKGSMQQIKKKDLGYSNGRVEKYTKVIGREEFSMELAHIKIPLAELEKANGAKVNELGGCNLMIATL